MPLGTVKTLAEIEQEVQDVIKGSIVDSNKVSSPSHRQLMYDLIATLFNMQIGSFSGGYWYAGNPTLPAEGDQRQRPNNGKFEIEEYVSGSWTLKTTF